MVGFVIHPNISQVQMAAPKHVVVIEVLNQANRSKLLRKPWGKSNGLQIIGHKPTTTLLGVEISSHLLRQTTKDSPALSNLAKGTVHQTLSAILPLLGEITLVGMQ